MENEIIIPEHVKRIITERNETAERLSKLILFLYSDKRKYLDDVQQGNLRVQLDTMVTYLDMLNLRIEYDIKKENGLLEE